MTQLCAIPNCRIRHRHLPDCADDTCGGCLPRVTDEGLVCDACTDRALDRLAAIVDLTPDARLVAAGLVRLGSRSNGGKPGSRSPGNDEALDTLNDVNNRLTTIARDIAETRGLQTPSAGPGVTETLIEAGRWLCGQAGWLRHAVDDQGGPYAAAVFAEIAECASRMRGIVDGPAPKKYLGPCGATVECNPIRCAPDCPEDCGIRECEGNVYGRPGASKGRCATCKAEVDQHERRQWLDGVVREWAFRAAEIAAEYRVNVDTIRSWAHRGRLASYWRTEAGLVTPWIETDNEDEIKARGPRLHYVGDVLDLAEADALRRHEAGQKRARLAAAKAVESETAA